MTNKKDNAFITLLHNIKVYFFWSVFAVGAIVISVSFFAMASEPYTLRISPSPFGFQLVNEEYLFAELRAKANFEAAKPKGKPAVKAVKPTPQPTAIVKKPLALTN
jgi:hypothetical protein